MFNGLFHVPEPLNEPGKSYAPGSPEKAELKAKLAELLATETEVPMVIGGEEVRSDQTAKMICPHDHQHALGTYHMAEASHVTRAIEAAQKARETWCRMPCTGPVSCTWIRETRTGRERTWSGW